MTNHILIGLGGTGGKILAAFRHSLYELEGKKDPSPNNIEYLYVDSNPEFMDIDSSLWRIPGDSLYIGNSATLNIQGKDLRGTLANLHRYPSILPWIGGESKWSHIQSAIGEGIGGQKRRLGRFLFASQASEFLSRVKAQYNHCKERTNSTNVVFHIVCGLAGGTGSGSVVDAIGLIRKEFPRHRENRIFVYCLLPDRVPDPSWLRPGGAYHANGYAALVELNALAIADYQPYDLTGKGERLHIGNGAHKDSTAAPPFDGCYVFTNENEANRTIELSKDGEFYEVVGGFLYQKIVAVDADAWQESLARYETMENMISDPSEAEGGIPVRSTRFASFGMKRLVIPEREIKEYLVYRSAEQALLQSLYNHPGDSGYLDYKSPEAPPARLKLEDIRAEWRMSPEHLLQELPILELPPESPEYKSLRQEWGLSGPLIKVVKDNEKNPLLWMAALNEICQKRFNQDFRGVGVDEFFRIKAKEVGAQVRAITTRVEKYIFTKWEAGDWGLVSCEETLQLTANWLQEQRTELAKKRQKAMELAGGGSTRSELERLIEANNREWPKIGPLSARFGKRDELLTAQAGLYMDWYRCRTLLLACDHADKLLRDLAEKMGELIQSVQAVIALHLDGLNGSGSGGAAFFGVRNHFAERCLLDEAMDLGAPVIKYYEPKRVHEFADALFREKEICGQMARNFRETLRDFLPGEKGFFLLRQRLHRGNLMDALTDAQVETLVETSHKSLVEKNQSLDPVLGENIVDKLAKNYAGKNKDLEKFCLELLSLSGTFLKWDEGQRQASEAGLKRESDQWVTGVIFPKSPNAGEFRDVLDQAFAAASKSKGTFRPLEGRKPQEIVMISLRNLFPLRYSWHVSELRRLYEEFLAQKNGELERSQALMELTSEDRDFAPLFPLSREDRETRYLPMLFTAIALEWLQPQQDPATGRNTLTWMPGDRQPLALGADLEHILEKSTTDVLAEVRHKIQERIRAATPVERQALSERLEAMLSGLPQQFTSALDPKRQRHETGLRAAWTLLNQPA